MAKNAIRIYKPCCIIFMTLFIRTQLAKFNAETLLLLLQLILNFYTIINERLADHECSLLIVSKKDNLSWSPVITGYFGDNAGFVISWWLIKQAAKAAFHPFNSVHDHKYVKLPVLQVAILNYY